MTVSRAARELRRGLARRASSAVAARETPAWWLWAVTGRGHLDLLLARLPRRRRAARTVTVFVAAPVRFRRSPDGPGGR
ncbi:hypothetical protein ABZY09_05870 [Streptomyces sp. NPDC002928]|uniref:hypothetical protein n=1 Tax=Streptomyces sp. NPDC002928 TaxID=3154440 RepID=UPI0033B73A44